MIRAVMMLLAFSVVIPSVLLSGCAGFKNQPRSASERQPPDIIEKGDWRPETARPNHLALARDLVGHGHYTVAMAQLKRSLTTHGHEPEPHTLLGICYRETGDLNAAIAGFERAIELDEEYAAAHGGLGIAYYMAGQYDSARAAMEKAVNLDPADANHQNNLGVLEMRCDRPAAAMHRFEQCLRIKPDHPSATNNLAECLVRLERDQDALTLLSRRFSPATALNNLGAIYLSVNRPANARKMFRWALSRNHNFAPARRNLDLLDKKEEATP